MRWLTLSILALLLVACGNGADADADLDALESPSNRSLVVTSDYPAVVMVVLPGGHGLCTGTFVSPTAVLTAAHCTQDDGTYTIVSSFGIFRTDTRRSFGPGVVEDPEDLALLIFGEPIARARKGQVIPLGAPPGLTEKVRLVGFGCSDFELRRGTGLKRTGTNQVSRLGDYIEVFSPKTRDTASQGAKGLIGSDNRTGTCFGDSGGPMLHWQQEAWGVSAISHAGGARSDGYVSGFVDLNRPSNFDFLRNVDAEFDLGLFDACRTSVQPGFGCQVEFASAQIEKFLRMALSWLRFW